MTRRGFSLVELLTVVAVMGVLASIAIPKYRQARSRARAAEVITAMITVRGGAFNYQGSLGAWPQSTGRGRVPPGLGAFLPAGGASCFPATAARSSGPPGPFCVPAIEAGFSWSRRGPPIRLSAPASTGCSAVRGIPT